MTRRKTAEAQGSAIWDLVKDAPPRTRIVGLGRLGSAGPLRDRGQDDGDPPRPPRRPAQPAARQRRGHGSARPAPEHRRCAELRPGRRSGEPAARGRAARRPAAFGRAVVRRSSPPRAAIALRPSPEAIHDARIAGSAPGQALLHHRGQRQGARAGPRRARHHRLGRRRARLRHPGQRQGGGHPGRARRQDQIHRRRWRPRAEGPPSQPSSPARTA